MKLRERLGMFLLAIWLILTGLVSLAAFTIPSGDIILAVIAIVTGILIFLEIRAVPGKNLGGCCWQSGSFWWACFPC